MTILTQHDTTVLISVHVHINSAYIQLTSIDIQEHNKRNMSRAENQQRLFFRSKLAEVYTVSKLDCFKLNIINLVSCSLWRSLNVVQIEK